MRALSDLDPVGLKGWIRIIPSSVEMVVPCREILMMEEMASEADYSLEHEGRRA